MKDQVKYPFGTKLRAVRERKRMTMKELAAGIGVSESLISQIERNRISPSLDTLLAIAEALEIDMEYLFEEYKQKRNVSIVRKEERYSHVIEGVRYEQLSKFGGEADEHALEAVILEIPAGLDRGNTEYGHPGKELGFILSGSGEFHLGSSVHPLGPGDSISFSSDTPHRLCSTGGTSLQALWVITPPRMFPA